MLNKVYPFLKTLIYVLLYFKLISNAYSDTVNLADTGADNDSLYKVKVTNIYPNGESVENISQIIVQFDKNIDSSLGQVITNFPIIISPEINCNWQWLNSSTLSCNISTNSKLQLATTYSINIKKGSKFGNNQTIEIENDYSAQFTNKRPNVYNSWLVDWESPNSPIIKVIFTQPITKESLLKHLYFASIDPNDQNSVENNKISIKAENIELSKEKTENGIVTENNQEWLIRPSQPLPYEKYMGLIIDPGLISLKGIAPSLENRVLTRFKTYSDKFSLISLRCFDSERNQINIPLEKIEKNKQLCDPISGIQLELSSPTLIQQAKCMLKFDPLLNGIDKDKCNNQEMLNNSYYSQEISFFNFLQANKEYSISIKEVPWWLKVKDFVLSLLGITNESLTLKDKFGRSLDNFSKIKFSTSHRRPNYEITNQESVLEKNLDSDLPLYITNIEEINLNYNKITASGSEYSLTKNYISPKVEDIQFAIPLKIRELLKNESGAVWGKITTTPNVANEYNNTIFSQVTPYQVYVKLGHFNTLVWVTDLATGMPINQANVSVYSDTISKLSLSSAITESQTNDLGIANLPGTNVLDPNLELYYNYGNEKNKLFVKIQKDNDIAILPINYSFIVDTYRSSDYNIFSFPRKKYEYIKAWGTTAQGIYKPGDLIKYKVYIRDTNNEGITQVDRNIQYNLKLIDPMGKVVHEVKDIILSGFGSYNNEFSLPEKATVGWYHFEIQANDKLENTITLSPMRVLVSDFSPAPFRVSTKINSKNYGINDTIEVVSEANLYSGGPYCNAPAKININLKEAKFQPSSVIAQGFLFNSKLPKNSDTNYNKYEFDRVYNLFQFSDFLNKDGQLKANYKLNDHEILYGKLEIESSIQDDRGKYFSDIAQANYLGVDRLVGLRNTKWVYNSGESANIEELVLDKDGNPIEGVQIATTIEKKKVTVAKIKTSGNVYNSEYNISWQKVGGCDSISHSDKPTACSFIPKEAGDYRVTATIKDSKERIHVSQLNIWVSGSGYNLWDSSDYYLEIIPEKSSYKVGEVGRYLVKNPYPGNEALITIERYGIIDSFVQKLDNSTSIIEIPIKPEYLPGFYVSVVINSPRVPSTLPQIGELDLGKPTFKTGYHLTQVEDPDNKIAVNISSDKTIYKPGESVKLNIITEPKKPLELAVIVLDSAVFDLLPDGKSYFDLNKGIIKLEDLSVVNFSLLTKILGRQKFETKGANQGGDGGVDFKVRDTSKLTAYWNPSVITNEQGEAHLDFTIPDNLTEWKVLVIASDDSNLSGLGEYSFKVNQDIEIRPIMPNQVYQGDLFEAGFSFFNRTSEKARLKVKLQVQGEIENNLVDEKILNIDANDKAVLYVPVKVSKNYINITNTENNLGKLDFLVTAVVEGKNQGDSLQYSIPVNNTNYFNISSEYGVLTEGTLIKSIFLPNDIVPNYSKIDLTLSPTVIGNITPIIEYLRDYTYQCWEQKLSKGLAGAYYSILNKYVSNEFTWQNSELIAKNTIAQALNFQAENGGFSYFQANNEYTDPYLSVYTAMVFNRLRDLNYQIPEQIQNNLNKYLLELLRKDISLSGDRYSENMYRTTRVAALSALAKTNLINLEELVRYKNQLSSMNTLELSYYLKAVSSFPEAKSLVKETLEALINKSHKSVGELWFKNNNNNNNIYQNLLGSELRNNCIALDSILEAMQNNSEELKTITNSLAEFPTQLTRAIIDKVNNKKGLWGNTQENVACLTALYNYSKMYEFNDNKLIIDILLNNSNIFQYKSTDLNSLSTSYNIKEADLGNKLQLEFKENNDLPKNTKSTLKEKKDLNKKHSNIYYNIRLKYAMKQLPTNSSNYGMEIYKEYSVLRDGKWVLLNIGENDKDNNVLVKKGELVRVDLYVLVPVSRSFVVVNDPVPGGLEVLNKELKTTSSNDLETLNSPLAENSTWFKNNDWLEYSGTNWWEGFYSNEIKNEVVRFYSENLIEGKHHLSYLTQVIATGNFVIMPSLAQEMYNTEIYGSTPTRYLESVN